MIHESEWVLQDGEYRIKADRVKDYESEYGRTGGKEVT